MKPKANETVGEYARRLTERPRKAVLDTTGLPLVGRKPDGQYVYSQPGAGDVVLTHEQRCVLTQWRLVLAQLLPAARLIVTEYALNFVKERNVCRLPNVHWLILSESVGRRLAEELAACEEANIRQSQAALLNVSVDETPGVERGSTAWRDLTTKWTVKLALATRDWTRWPKVKPALRDSLSKEQRKARGKARAKERKASATLTDKWEAKRAHAAKMTAQWQGRQRSAERKVKKWSRALRLAERKVKQLNEPKPKETSSDARTVCPQGVAI